MFYLRLISDFLFYFLFTSNLRYFIFYLRLISDILLQTGNLSSAVVSVPYECTLVQKCAKGAPEKSAKKVLIKIT